jgi:hypothetical protein
MDVVGVRTALDRRVQQASRFVTVATVQRGGALLQELFGLALALGERAACPVDVSTGPRVASIEEQRARPDVDRLLVAGGKVVIEAGEQQLLDFRVAITVRRVVDRACAVGAKRIGHRLDGPKL